MATVKKQGRGYKITVSHGYDINGKQLRSYMTWIPDPGMSARQIEKELNRQAVLFEEKVLSSGIKNSNNTAVPAYRPSFAATAAILAAFLMARPVSNSTAGFLVGLACRSSVELISITLMLSIVTRSHQNYFESGFP